MLYKINLKRARYIHTSAAKHQYDYIELNYTKQPLFKCFWITISVFELESCSYWRPHKAFRKSTRPSSSIKMERLDVRF